MTDEPRTTNPQVTPGESTKETQAAMLEAALYFASKGMPVFPSPPGTKKSHKKAKYSNGERWGQTRNADQIRRDFAKWPDANVCIAVGPDSGYFVLEVDTPQGHDVDGFASLRDLETQYGPLPETRSAISPSGSIHYYFNWPKTGTVRNSASEIGPGIDVRGEGGMCLAPPSLKPGVGAYRWHNRHAVVDAPEWLLKLLVAETDQHISGEKQEATTLDLWLVGEALKVLPTSLLFDERNYIGMAAWRATDGHEYGFQAWSAWLQRSGQYNERRARDRWRHYFQSPATELGIGTLIFLAKETEPGWYDRVMYELMDETLEQTA